MSMFQVERRQRDAAKPKHLRKRGVLPMALVERNHETMLIQAPVSSLREAMSHVDGHGRIEFQIDGEGPTRRAIVKHIEQDALKHELIHVTLQEVSDEDTVKMDVPVVAVGHSEVLDGDGVALQSPMDHVKLRGRMIDLPERLEVDVSKLNIGDHIAASDVTLPAGVDLISPADATLFTVTIIRDEPLEVPSENEAETGEAGAEGASSAAPGEQGAGGSTDAA